MKIHTSRIATFAAAIFISTPSIFSLNAQSLLNETGTSILAPTLAPPGGYASNPQEYLSVSWSVVENASLVYTYTYTIQNPTGDVLMNNNGTLTTTPEIYEAFSIGFDTTVPGAYIPNTQTGGNFDEVNSIDLAWFFGPAIGAGSSATVSYESYMAPTMGNANASGAPLPSPWSSSAANGQQLPIPDAPATVPEPKSAVLIALTALFIPAVVRKKAKKNRRKDSATTNAANGN
jgi:hypothetical protein